MVATDQLCGVCGRGEARYRCPRCRTRYCSCGCYRDHKQEKGRCVEPPAPAPETSEEPGYRYPTPDTVPPEKLCQLRASKPVLEALCNEHLRALLRELDRSKDPERMLGSLMREPIFLEFADACLEAVRGGENQESDDHSAC